MIVRPPRPALRPLVATVWASHADPGGGALDHMLPSASPHLVFRLDGPGGGHGVVGGPRTGPHLRTPATAGRTAGAVLHPGVTHLLLDAHGLDLAERHSGLDDLWGTAADTAADRLAAAPTLDALLHAFEAVLVERLTRPHSPHPAVALGLARLPVLPVHDVVRESGYSHRRFVEVFTRASGFSPKRYARLVRFERTVRLWGAAPHTPLAQLAVDAGYSDQAHFTREFVAHAGMTPGDYRRTGAVGSRHVSVEVNSVQDGPGAAGAHSAA